MDAGGGAKEKPSSPELRVSSLKRSTACMLCLAFLRLTCSSEIVDCQPLLLRSKKEARKTNWLDTFDSHQTCNQGQFESTRIGAKTS